ncbi:MAG TPA: hypothetical protein VK742_12455 [Candidatus Sulfotelmatobacter sp.]|jgi:uncharacterized membrane protein YkoI|nr:hypothetical protein [Candidatus Sulfotelmatobacter sp.]
MPFKRCVLISLGCGMTFAAFADDQSKTVALSETPAAVQKTIQTQTSGGTLGDIDKVAGAITTYDVELTAKDGQERDFTVAEDGVLLSVEVALAETPPAVQTSIKTLMGGGGLESIDKNLDDSEITYDVELTATNGQEKYFNLADDGTLLSVQVTLNESPDAVQKTIATKLNGGKLEDIEKMFGDDRTNYDVTITMPDGQEKGYTVEADGGLTSVEVALEEAPPAAKKTILTRIGDGKILRIDRSFVKRAGVFPYEVEGLKDGKPFNFSVGPKGRFLGMDD